LSNFTLKIVSLPLAIALSVRTGNIITTVVVTAGAKFSTLALWPTVSFTSKGKMPHPKETKIICEQYIAELQREQELAKTRAVEATGDARFYEREQGTARGLAWAEKWFKERFGHFLKEE
jgi:hypothetical protein